MRNPKYNAILERMAEVHDRKNEDYAEDGNPYSNFEEAALIAGITVEQQFLSLIGVKLARIKVLSSYGKLANYESLEDTYLDLAVYSSLLASYVQRPSDTREEFVEEEEVLTAKEEENERIKDWVDGYRKWKIDQGAVVYGYTP